VIHADATSVRDQYPNQTQTRTALHSTVRCRQDNRQHVPVDPTTTDSSTGAQTRNNGEITNKRRSQGRKEIAASDYKTSNRDSMRMMNDEREVSDRSHAISHRDRMNSCTPSQAEAHRTKTNHTDRQMLKRSNGSHLRPLNAPPTSSTPSPHPILPHLMHRIITDSG